MDLPNPKKILSSELRLNERCKSKKSIKKKFFFEKLKKNIIKTYNESPFK